MTGELDFSGKRVLVVGGSSGIGNGIAQAFHAKGAQVHVWGTRASPDEYDAAEGSDLAGLGYTQVDVADPAAIAAAPDPFPDGLDVLVHSQGMVLYKRQEFERAGFDKVMAVNVASVMQISQRFHDALAGAKGSVIVISSIGAFKATFGNPAYAASKAAAVQLVRTLALAWAGAGIRVNGIAPSLVDTKMTRVTMDNAERRAGALSRIPLGRFGTVEDMANVALFLASPLAGFMCGQTLVVDGGVTL
ncbi:MULTISPECIES: SDR family oxidoreductase [unclassified Sphingomonas]|uniref:SDR family NAD(P)-dependent oxidoreductase n=1 Tax=unclassified Sphingomonas TaxID=196159 RepID=UPI00092B4FA3|nr:MULTISPECIES: SDR family oxidoreductase [unclassified Sphingomonas]MBN8849499.1 SDR family oxidoreductase [Sphingomonas sp.]OJV34412.1 MAG: 3-oxoacyl-ACP reductase [Sphingomonas sp. 67-36]